MNQIKQGHADVAPCIEMVVVRFDDLMTLARQIIAEQMEDCDEEFMAGRAHGVGSLHSEILALSKRTTLGQGQDEILSLHRQLAGEKLRADQGWERAEAKSRECIQLRERMASTSTSIETPAAQGCECKCGNTLAVCLVTSCEHSDLAPAAQKGTVTDYGTPAAPAVEPKAGYCADCNSWGGGHRADCQRRQERFTPAPVATDLTQAGEAASNLDRWQGHEIMNDPSLDCVEVVKLEDVRCVEGDSSDASQSAKSESADVAFNALSALLWLYRRLSPGYGRLAVIDGPIKALAHQVGIDVTKDLAERGPEQHAENENEGKDSGNAN